MRARAAIGAAGLVLTGGLVAGQHAEATSNRALVASLESSIHYDVAKLGYSVSVGGARTGLLAETDLGAKKIILFRRANESRALLVKTLAYEFGHAVDETYNTAATRKAWLKARGAKAGTTWFAPDLAPESAYGSGDFADVFSDWATGSTSWSSTVAARPSAAQLKKLAVNFHRGQAVPKVKTVTTVVTTTVTEVPVQSWQPPAGDPGWGRGPR